MRKGVVDLPRWVDGILAVTYDCWGTLLQDRDWEGAMERRVGALQRFLDLSDDDARALIDEAWNHHDEAWKQVESFGPGRMAAYCLEEHDISDDDSINTLTREFEEASIDAGVEAVAGAKATLDALSAKNIRLALICDTGFTPGRVVRTLLDDAGLLDHFEALCFSDEVGVPKPGQEIFAKALAELGVQPYETVHVGDLKRTDVAGARNVGIHPIRFRGVHDDECDSTEAECVIDRHEEILDVLGLT